MPEVNFISCLWALGIYTAGAIIAAAVGWGPHWRRSR